MSFWGFREREGIYREIPTVEKGSVGVFGILNLNLREFGRGFEIVEIGWMGFKERDRTVVVRFLEVT